MVSRVPVVAVVLVAVTVVLVAVTVVVSPPLPFGQTNSISPWGYEEKPQRVQTFDGMFSPLLNVTLGP